METRGFAVQRHYLLDTAWVATYTHHGQSQGTEGVHQRPVLGVNSEMDALPGIGHACGHNLIGVAGVAVACAVKVAMETFGVGGKVVLLGTPGELFESAYFRVCRLTVFLGQLRRVGLERYCYGRRGRMKGWTSV